MAALRMKGVVKPLVVILSIYIYYLACNREKQAHHAAPTNIKAMTERSINEAPMMMLCKIKYVSE